jgi:NADH-quinone oxidoreductase subunit F
MSISGHVVRPGNYEVAMSRTMGHLIDDLAGGVPGGRALKAVIPGGASSPILGPEVLDILCAPEALAAAGSMAGSAGVMVIDDTTCIVQLALRTAAFYTHESCGKCTPCREGTRWITDTLQRIEDGIADPAEIDLVLEICDNVEGKCLCPLGDACAMPVRSMVKRFREEFDAHVELGYCPLHDTSSLSSLYPQPRSLLPLATVSPS